jgi:hypothetical protein
MAPSVSGRTIRACLFSAAAVLYLSACRYVATSPTTDATSSGPASNSTSLTYTTDVAPILNADCTRCHSGSTAQGGVDLSSYSGVLKVVVAGSANSILVLVTQPGGFMSSQLSGNRSAKAATIRSWVVDFQAAQ